MPKIGNAFYSTRYDVRLRRQPRPPAPPRPTWFDVGYREGWDEIESSPPPGDGRGTIHARDSYLMGYSQGRIARVSLRLDRSEILNTIMSGAL